jgi:tRNA threonylcarbamoyladenosine biosynthesis protein TsaE
VIELISDLGGGKTTFVQGLAAALGYAGPVTSPTFTLSNIYELTNGRQLHHYDLYRLGEGGVVADELAEDIAQGGIITIVEWPGIARDVLPKDRLTISFEPTSDTGRQLTFTAGGPKSAAILKELKA